MSDCSTHAFDVPLKSCPFCGGEARIFALQIGKGWRVVCGKPFCAQGPDGDTEAEAIAAWNTRAERTCHNKQKDVGMFECSACGISGITIKSYGLARVEPARCPNCGAKVMDRKEER